MRLVRCDLFQTCWLLRILWTDLSRKRWTVVLVVVDLLFVVVAVAFTLRSSVKSVVDIVTLPNVATTGTIVTSSNQVSLWWRIKEGLLLGRMKRYGLVCLGTNGGIVKIGYPMVKIGWGPPKEVAVHQYTRPNVGAVPTRGLYAANMPARLNPFVSPGSRSTNHGLNSAYGRAVGNNIGQYSNHSVGQYLGNDELGNSYGAKTRGPLGDDQSCRRSGPVRPRLSDGPNFSRPNANCVHISDVPWRTKSRARVFYVDSSQYDSY